MMNPELSSFILDFHSNWSSSLFTASVTMASFLFTMKSFVIQNVKDKVYDTEYHKERVRQRRESGQDVEYYGGLRRLAMLLKWTIMIAAINALLQVVSSAMSSAYFSIFCLFLALVSCLLFILVVWIVSENIGDLIKHAEDSANSNTHS